jgi:hypothetical protein
VNFLLLLVTLVVVPAGRVGKIDIGGRSPDLFFVDVAMLVIVVSSGFLLPYLKGFWANGWRPLLLFLGVVAVGWLLSPDRTTYLGSVRPVVYAVAVVGLTQRAVASEADVRLLCAVLSVGGAAILVQVLASTWTGDLTSLGDKEDVILDWGRSNYFATFALLSFFVSLALASSAPTRTSGAMSLAGAGAAALLLLLTRSRGALLALLFVGVGVAPFFSATMRRRLRWWILPIPLALAGTLLYAVVGGFASGSEEFGFGEALLDSGNFRRIDAWLSAGSAFLSNPLFGIGWSGTTVGAESLTETNTTTHSLLLQLLAETGLVGCGAFVVLIARALRSAGPKPFFSIDPRLRSGIRLGMIATLLHSLIEPSFWGVQFVPFFWASLTVLMHTSQEPAAALEAAGEGSAPGEGGDELAERGRGALG